MKTAAQHHSMLSMGMLFCLLPLAITASAAQIGAATETQPGFSFDCDNTPASPCRKLVAQDPGESIRIESSSAAWSERYGQVILVSDNYNDLSEHGAGHYAIAYFDPADEGMEITVRPLLTPAQAAEFQLYDLEGVTLDGNRLYAIGSLALHGKDPDRDRWQRHQLIQLDLQKSNSHLAADNLSHVSERWPNFRDWVVSKSGYQWSGEETRGRAEAEGINVEALSVTDSGNLIIGFRGPMTAEGGALALEFQLPASADEEPVLIDTHMIPPLVFDHIPPGAAKTLRAISRVIEKPGEYYVLLGPIGYEKEQIVLARWNSTTGKLTKATLLPPGFVGEGVTPIPGGKVLVVDDLAAMILIATENSDEQE